ncbi:MAG: DUF1573 domain-containing protein [bacterium]
MRSRNHIFGVRRRLPGAAAWAVLSLARGLAAPIAQCDSNSFDFGTAPASATVQHTFYIGNGGDTPLSISADSVCCGATASISPEPVRPAGTGAVAVTLNLRGRQGAVKKALYFATNDPTQPKLRLVLTGHVQAGLVAKPSALSLLDCPRDTPVTAVVRVTDDSAADFRATNAWTTAPWLRVYGIAMTNHTAEVQLATVPPFPEFPSTATVLVAVNTSAEPLAIPVIATRWEAISAWPRTLFLNPAQPKLPAEHQVALYAQNNRAFRVQSVRLTGMSGHARFEPLADGRWRVILQEMALPSETATGMVVVATDHPLRPEVRIPVLYAAKKATP